MHFMFAALCLWLMVILFGGWWLTRLAEPEQPRPSQPPDPIVQLVDKWAHDWERGRA